MKGNALQTSLPGSFQACRLQAKRRHQNEMRNEWLMGSSRLTAHRVGADGEAKEQVEGWGPGVSYMRRSPSSRDETRGTAVGGWSDIHLVSCY